MSPFPLIYLLAWIAQVYNPLAQIPPLTLKRRSTSYKILALVFPL